MPLSFTADLQAELLTSDGRVPLVLKRELASIAGEVAELTIPDGTLNRVLLPPRGGRLNGLLVTSDKAIRVTLGPVAQNQPLMLAPGGVIAFFDVEALATSACAVSYTPGDGSVATCLVVAGTSYVGMPIVEPWDWHGPSLTPFVTQWTYTFDEGAP